MKPSNYMASVVQGYQYRGSRRVVVAARDEWMCYVRVKVNVRGQHCLRAVSLCYLSLSSLSDVFISANT